MLARRPLIALAAILVGGPVAATTARALRALWFPWPKAEGIEVGPEFGGRLHETVQAIARRVGAPGVHRVLVTEANNASMEQVPRIGVFWPVNTLLLGYPLLATLSADQMRAVIAHELAHLTHAHGRLSSWVYRTRNSWLRLLDVLERHQSVPAHVYLLFRFYVPRLDVQSLAVSRRQELLADRLAAEVTGPEVTAQALVATGLADGVFDDVFWPAIFERVAREPDPPAPFADMTPRLWEADAHGIERLNRLLAGETDVSGTHPALRDRLAAIGQTPRWPAAVGTAAVDGFFGPQTIELVAALDRAWQARREGEWRRLHGEIRARRERLAELEAMASPTAEQTFERSRLTYEEGDERAAFDLCLAAHRQGHPAAGLEAGRMLLGREDASGIALIDAAMAADPALVEDGCRAAVEFLERRGRHVDAHAYRVRLIRESTRAGLARDERTDPTVRDRAVRRRNVRSG